MHQHRRPVLVVVGTGLAGARVIEEVLARAPDRFTIRAFGDEPHGTYNRILLSNVLAGTAAPEDLWLNPLDWYRERGVFVHAGVRVEAIDLQARTVSGGNGRVVEPFDHLILATGSRAVVPDVPGNRLDGTYVFRTIDDCSAIGAAARESDSAVVIGGGLLGLEAAKGLLAHGARVTVVETAAHLMPRQLDPSAGHLLAGRLEAMGIEVRTGVRLSHLQGDEDGAVEAVCLEDGTVLETTLVVFACGTRPNAEAARAAGLKVGRGIVVDGRMHASHPNVWAVGECAEHEGECVGLVEPVYEQARVLADAITGADPEARYMGSRPVATLKVMGVSLVSMGDVQAKGRDVEAASHSDAAAGVYKKVVVRDGRLAGAILLGDGDPGGMLRRMFLDGAPVAGTPVDLLAELARAAPGLAGEASALPGTAQICNCNAVSKGVICAAIKAGCRTVAAVGQQTRAGTGCGSCRPLIAQLVEAGGGVAARPAEPNKIEVMKKEKDGLDAKDDLLRLAEGNDWQGMTEDDKQRAKWHGLFFRKQTPGHFMLRLRHVGGRLTARQLDVIADLSDELGRGFCDLTTRQQVQLRWFTLADVPEIWRRLDAVGLDSRQTGLDNVRGLVGCPMAGRTPNELFDATGVMEELDGMLVGNREVTNLPRKFNLTITACLENCCHAETQDVALVPARRDGVDGFNVFVGGKQGSGGYTPAEALDVFVPRRDAAALCKRLVLIFRDHGGRTQRTRARLRHLIDERGLPWLRAELGRRLGARLSSAGQDVRKKTHTDHLGIQPQKPARGEAIFSAGLLVPVGRITSAQMRGVADLARRYGSGDLRLTVQQNVIVQDIPEHRLAAFREEPLLKELTPDPSPIMRGLVSCTGNDYCHMALIETKGWALQVARELESRTVGLKLAPLTMHWSGCPASCGMHQVATIGFQGCRSRVNGHIVDAAHVCVKGAAGPEAKVAEDLMYDVPCDQLADALLLLVKHLPRK